MGFQALEENRTGEASYARFVYLAWPLPPSSSIPIDNPATLNIEALNVVEEDPVSSFIVFPIFNVVRCYKSSLNLKNMIQKMIAQL